ncbi:hypothetical protein VNI00_016655 [Paramarasmius palmivorus]|uniref:Uncharacterized protein n=1 Tax=Paramarasmius palmivorus TaxID=297713 RepID=A0AAW0BBX4_9AGAR
MSQNPVQNSKKSSKKRTSGSSKSSTSAQRTPGVRFAHVSATEAAEGRDLKKNRQNGGLCARLQATSVYTDHLSMTPDQHTQIDAIYASHAVETYDFVVAGPEAERQQKDAGALMATYGLTCEALDEIGNRWSIKWSRAEEEMTKVLLQCDCGYDHETAGSRKVISMLFLC